MAEYVCGIHVPEEFKETEFIVTDINVKPVKRVETVYNSDGTILSVDYYEDEYLERKVFYEGSSVSEIRYYKEGKIDFKQVFRDDVLVSEYFYKASGEISFSLEYEYKLGKIFAVSQILGLNKRKVELKYDFLDRITGRNIYFDDKLVLTQHYFYDAMGRISAYDDENYSLLVEKFTKDNKLHRYRITDKMKHEIVITNNFDNGNYVDSKVSVNGLNTIVKDINYVDNIMTKKPTKSMDDLDLIISKLFNGQESSVSTKRSSSELEDRLDSNLVNIIEYKTKVRPLPIALRKRLMYQQFLKSHG